MRPNGNIIYTTDGKTLQYIFITNLKKVLERYDIKQVDFAKQIGVSKQTLNNYLSQRRTISFDIVCIIIIALQHMIPKFNMLFLFEANQDIILHDKTNHVYDEKGTLINKLDNASLNILHKMLKNEFLPSFLKSIAKYFSDPTAAAHEHINLDEEILITSFIKHKSVHVILKHLILLLYNMAPAYHIIYGLNESATNVLNQNKNEVKEIIKLGQYLTKNSHRQLK